MHFSYFIIEFELFTVNQIIWSHSSDYRSSLFSGSIFI